MDEMKNGRCFGLKNSQAINVGTDRVLLEERWEPQADGPLIVYNDQVASVVRKRYESRAEHKRRF